jgi:hypothetical protein
VIIFFQNGSIIAADAGRATSAGDFGLFLTSTTNRAILGTLPSQFERQVTPREPESGRPSCGGGRCELRPLRG